MYNYHNKKKFICSILSMLLLAIGIGYAYLTSNLSISGNTNVSTNTWNIHFENIQVKDGSVTATIDPTLSNSNTSITYTIDLNRPKDYYEFTVDVKNDGTLPGKVSISTLSGITTEASSIIDYSVTYTNGNPVNIGDILNARAKKSIKVRVFYKDEIDPTDFPANDLNLTLTYTLQYVQSEEDEFDTNALIEQLKEENSSCFTKYWGQVTDQPGKTVYSSKVYFNTCYKKRNILFGGYCWQMIRTTETGGIKMIYNGKPNNNGGCGSSRSNHKGIVQSNYNNQTLNTSYLYGSSFTYDTSTNNFTLIDTELAIWSDSTYENLIGKYTCKNTTGTCTTLYNINGYISNTQAYASAYILGSTNYAQIGNSSYNINRNSPAMVGYMFNKVYKYNTGTLAYGSLTGNDVSYSNGTYTLLPASGESELGTTLDDTHHYSCNNTTGTCDKVRYYYGINFSTYYYIELNGEQNIDEALNNMLSSNDVNKYNSSIKGIIDAWYAQNLLSKTDMLEDTVYCNARNMINLSNSGWGKDGQFSEYLYFKNYNATPNLSCLNETDQFAVSNDKAKLKYPVGMINHEEWYNMNYTIYNEDEANEFRKTGAFYWSLSPAYYIHDNPSDAGINSDGSMFLFVYSYNPGGIRLAVSLKDNVVIPNGTGTEADPWVVE